MYNTIDSLGPAHWTPIRPRQPVFAGLREWFARRWPHAAAAAPALPAPPQHDDLAELDAHTLADIGAPERLLDRAMARREVQRQEREGLRIGLASGAWQHW